MLTEPFLIHEDEYVKVLRYESRQELELTFSFSHQRLVLQWNKPFPLFECEHPALSWAVFGLMELNRTGNLRNSPLSGEYCLGLVEQGLTRSFTFSKHFTDEQLTSFLAQVTTNGIHAATSAPRILGKRDITLINPTQTLAELLSIDEFLTLFNCLSLYFDEVQRQQPMLEESAFRAYWSPFWHLSPQEVLTVGVKGCPNKKEARLVRSLIMGVPILSHFTRTSFLPQ